MEAETCLLPPSVVFCYRGGVYGRKSPEFRSEKHKNNQATWPLRKLFWSAEPLDTRNRGGDLSIRLSLIGTPTKLFILGRRKKLRQPSNMPSHLESTFRSAREDICSPSNTFNRMKFSST